MSTRSTTHFCWNKKPVAIVYRHSDGYPEGAGMDLLRFLCEVKENLEDTRFDDPSCLASKYVVWLAGIFQRSTHLLDFQSVGVVLNDPPDIEYRYYVECSTEDERGLPPVQCYRVNYGGLEDGEEEFIPNPDYGDS